MRVLLIVIHVIASGILIGMVLLQKGKGADIGAAFGGASNTVFGPRGAQSFLAKLTTTSAIIFMLASFFLSNPWNILGNRSVMESVKSPVTQSAPAAPAPAAPASK